MQFDHFDKKFREAAEHHHPAYDENAWAKMEKLLDKHMPVEEKRRRFLFLILLLAALGITGLLIMQPWKQSRTISAGVNQPVEKTEGPVLNTNDSAPAEKSADKNKNAGTETSGPVTLAKVNEKQPNLLPGPVSISRDKNSLVKDKQVLKEEKPEKSLIKDKVEKNPQVANQPTLAPGNINDDAQNIPKNKTAPTREEQVNKPVQAENTAGKAVAEKEPVISKRATSKKKKTHGFFIALAGGPDLSFVNTGNPGRVKLFGGAAIGYTYNNRISLRTGFFTGRKIYSARPGDYNPPPNFYTYYPYLEKVDANCQIYEVPLAFSYHFNRTDKRQFFVSAAISSYFMKEEKYTYYYKTTPTGQTRSRNWTIKDENKHYLAGLGLSAGYTRQLSRHISMTVEPYTKIPISGLGYGKVKLNSAGVQFSAAFHPFNSKKK